MKNIKITLSLLILFVCFNSVYAQKKYGKISFKKAMDISEKQRVLGQKIAKTYLYLSNTPDDLKAKRSLAKSKRKFEKQNQILVKNATSEKTIELLKSVHNVWGTFKSILEEAPDNENAFEVVKINSLLLKKSNSLVASIVANNNDSKLMVSNYDLRSMYKELDDALNLLLVSNFVNEKVDDALVIAMLKWEDLSDDKDELLNNKFEEESLYGISSELTKAFDEITLLYENTVFN